MKESASGRRKVISDVLARSLALTDHPAQSETGPVLLFRFSALTHNGHRIHYDYPYATMDASVAAAGAAPSLTARITLG